MWVDKAIMRSGVKSVIAYVGGHIFRRSAVNADYVGRF